MSFSALSRLINSHSFHRNESSICTSKSFLHKNYVGSIAIYPVFHCTNKNILRKAKTDKKDSLKLASYALDRWTELREYTSAEDLRYTLKPLNRQFIQNTKKFNDDLKLTLQRKSCNFNPRSSSEERLRKYQKRVLIFSLICTLCIINGSVLSIY